MVTNLKDRVTIYEVAAAAGVSLATVSRVINNLDNVKPETKKKVQDAIKRLGYRPSGLAQALATSKTTNIGVVIPGANYVYISNLLHGLTDSASEKGYAITLFCTSNEKSAAMTAIDKVITSHVDGVVIFDDELDEDDVQKITGYQVPVVVVNNKIENKEKIASITFGYEHTLREYIIRPRLKNYQKPMYFLKLSGSGRLLERLERSFVNTHEEEHKPYSIIEVDDHYESIYQKMSEIFKTTHRGYFLCYRDSIAMAVLNAARDNGLRVPEDIEILSLIGTKYASLVRPKISNMSIDMYQVGLTAMDMLVKLLKGDTYLSRIKIESKYIELDSTK